MREFQTLKGSKAEGYNPKLTAARAKLAKIEGEIEKLIDTLTGQTRFCCNTQTAGLKNWTRNGKSS